MTSQSQVSPPDRTSLRHTIRMCYSTSCIFHLFHKPRCTPHLTSMYSSSRPCNNLSLCSKDNYLNISGKAGFLRSLTHSIPSLCYRKILAGTDIHLLLNLLSCFISPNMSDRCWLSNMYHKENNPHMCNCLASHKIEMHTHITKSLSF